MQILRLARSQHLFSQGFATDRGTLQLLLELDSATGEDKSRPCKRGEATSVYHVAAAVPGTGIHRLSTQQSISSRSDLLLHAAYRRVTQLGEINSALLVNDPEARDSGTGTHAWLVPCD